MTVIDEGPLAGELLSLLARAGYGDELIVTEYRVQVARSQYVADVVAFSDRPCDISTAALVASTSYAASPQHLEELLAASRALAAPCAIIARAAELRVLNSADGTLLASVPVDGEPGDRVMDLISPRRLALAKSPGQLSLFPVEAALLANARRSAVRWLSEHVSSVRGWLLEVAGAGPGLLSERDAAALVLDALTVACVRDKLHLPDDPLSWKGDVANRFGDLRHRTREHSPEKRQLQQLAVEALSEGVTFTSLDSVVISDLYESRLVDPGDRNQHGVVYTPYELAQRIMAAIPLELIEPEHRSVLDLACGSGTLLLAAHDRMTQCLPVEARKGSLLDALHGWDRDEFAVRLTHLSLTLRQDPPGNGWDVVQADSLDPSTVSKGVKPTVLVANPPYGGRRTGSSEAQSRSRDDAVTPFVTRMLDLLPQEGLMGLLTPQSFWTAEHSAAVRTRLAEQVEILEICRLPERTFRDAAVRASFVVGRRRRAPSPTRPVLVRSVGRSAAALQRYYATGAADEWTWQTEVPSKRGRAHVQFTDVLHEPGLAALTDVVRIRSGPPNAKVVGEGVPVRWLRQASLPSHFGIVSASTTEQALYPGSFDQRASWPIELYEAPKLLVSRVSRSDNRWKLKVMWSWEALVPSSNLLGLTVRDDWADAHPNVDKEDVLLAIGGILGSALVNAAADGIWQGNIPVSFFSDLRLPKDWVRLSRHVRPIVTLAQKTRDPSAVSKAAVRLDNAVFDAYRTPDPLRHAAIAMLTGSTAREGSVRYPARPDPVTAGPAALLERDGCLMPAPGREHETDEAQIVPDAPHGLVRIWVDGITPDEGVLVETPAAMPGWARLPEATFVATVPDGDLASARFRLHRYAFESWPESRGPRRIEGDT
jgi:hypothetical protein